MRAVVHDRYGSPEVLRVADVERPVPKADEVLVNIHATTVNRTDCAIRAVKPFVWRFFAGVLRPKRKILGIELAGEVAEVGAAVTQFKVGDHVFGISPSKFGAHAEYICVRESAALAHKPTGITFAEAAAVCDGANQALASLRRAELSAGQKILIYGASGSCGTAAVQIARYFDADITAVCNTKNIELVKMLGADRVIDYTQEDFTKTGDTYDVILDAVDKTSFLRCRRLLRPGGVYIATDLGRLMVENLVLILWTSRIGKKRVRMGMPKYTKQDTILIKNLIETGQYRAVIDRIYTLEQVVDATRYVETQQKTGNVVLLISSHREKEINT